jgi:CubicO group peptidase (beta-lactamase class C family)
VSKKRNQALAALIVLAAGGLIAAVPGLFLYVSVTSTPIHPNPQDVPSVAASSPSPTWAGAVERGRQVVLASLVEQNLPGLSVAVGAGGDIVWAEGFGWADLERRVPVEPDTRFRIGTASKALTSAAVGLLVERGRLELDDPIQTYVPAFPLKQWPVTLRQLMGHVAGIRRDDGDEEPVHVHCEQTADALKRFAESPLRFEPGTQYRYSSYGWILVSAAVEAAADEPFSTFMRRHVFEPLGMDDTKADAGTGLASHLSAYHFPRFAADPRYGPQGPGEEDFSCFAGASAFISTPSDLVRFATAIGGGTLLQPATAHLLQSSQRLASGEETGYGLGWDLETVTLAGEPTRVIGYDGALRDGMVMSLMTIPPHGIVVAVTSNTSFADTPPIALKVAEIFMEQGRGAARQ